MERMKKRIGKGMLILLAVLTVIMVYPVMDAGAAQQEENGFIYGEAWNGEGVSISRYTGDAEVLEIPARLGGKDVVSISNGAFLSCKSLVEVTIPEGVADAAADVFDGCTNLKILRIPSSLTECNFSFVSCAKLEQLVVAPEHTAYTTVDGVLFNKAGTKLLRCPCGKTGDYTVPSAVTEIEYSAFENSQLTAVTVSSGVKTIGFYTFANSSVREVSLPDSLTEIPAGLFYGCEKLETMRIPAGVTKLGTNAYKGCKGIQSIVVASGNKNFTAVGTALFNKAKTQLLFCAAAAEGQFSVPGTVTSIGSYAFSGCQKITEISMPSKLTTISDAAFMDCSGLTGVTIPDSVTSIGGAAFSGCSSLGHIVLPAKLRTIKKSAFAGCSSLTGVEISGENTQYVSLDGVLYNKTETELVICPCGKGGTLELPEGITDLLPETGSSYELLGACNKLTGITIPSTYKGFSDAIYRFGGCTALREIHVAGDHESFCSIDGVVYDKAVRSVIFCPMGREKAYTMPDTVESMGQYAFHKCKGLTEVTVSPGVKKIGANCFHDCVIDTLTISDGTEELAAWAMEGSLIRKLYIPASVTSIASHAYGYKYDEQEMCTVRLDVQPVIGCVKGSAAWQGAQEAGLDIELVKSRPEIRFLDYRPDKTYDGRAVSEPGRDQLAVTAADYDEITFVWYRESVAESNKLSATPVSAGTYILTAVLQETDDRKGCVVQGSPVKIEKAEQPASVPASALRARDTDQRIKDVSLPEGWEWKNTDREKFLPAGTPVTAVAEYTGADKGNYKKETVEITITRQQDAPGADQPGTDPSGAGQSGNGSQEKDQPAADKKQEDADKAAPAKGEAFTDKTTKAVYTVTKSGSKNGTVTYTGNTAKKASKVTVPATVTIKGRSYKVTAIAANAFKNNKKLKKAVIGKNVTKIGKKAFYGCKKLKTIQIKTTGLKKKSVGSQAFAKIHRKAVVRVPKKKYAAYRKLLKAKGVTGKRKIKKN